MIFIIIICISLDPLASHIISQMLGVPAHKTRCVPHPPPSIKAAFACKGARQNFVSTYPLPDKSKVSRDSHAFTTSLTSWSVVVSEA